MPDITDPQAIVFSNEIARKAADLYAQAYYFAIQFQDQWATHGMGTLIPNTSDPIVDGSATDGRPPLTGADMALLKQRIDTLVSDLEANADTRLKHILAAAVNPTR